MSVCVKARGEEVALQGRKQLAKAVTSQVSRAQRAFHAYGFRLRGSCVPGPLGPLHNFCTIWNALAALPPISSYKKMALDSCVWTASVSKAIRGTGYDLSVRQGAMAHVNVHYLSS